MTREMINSGIEWIGSMPKNWKLERLQCHLDEVKESNDPIKTTQVLSLTNKLGVIPYEEKGEQGNKSKENLSEYKLAYPETIVANSMNILIGSVGLSRYYGCVSPVYYVYKGKENTSIEFFNFLFQTQEFQKELRRYANGILEIRLRVSSNNILKRYVPIPSKEEQEKIVFLLKEKLVKIDELIAIQDNQIKKLEDYKQKLITKIITNGVRSYSKFVDSGVNWIEYIPEECSIVKIKKVCSEKITDGTHATPEYTSEELGFPFLSSKDVRNGVIDWSDIKYITYETHENIQRGITPKRGDVLLSKNGSIGFSAVVDTDRKFDIYVTLALLRPNSLILSKYLKYALDSMTTQNQFNLHLIGIGVPNLHLNVIQDTKIILHPIKEQEKIVEYLDAKCEKIDELIQIKQQKIEKLNEYKKSLIYEYVTGKREVKEG